MRADDPTDARRWPRRRFWVAILLVAGLQVALLFWLSGPTPALPRSSAPAPTFRVRLLQPGEWLLLEDPTLFALPHERSASGPNTLKLPPLDFPVEDEPEPERWLPTVDEGLGAEFARFTRTNAPPPFPVAVVPEPAMAGPELPPLTPIMTASRLRIEGSLARRRLLTRVVLRGWPSAELLTNTVVHLLVDARGNIEFAQLGPRGSGSEAADQNALQLARTLRFEPLPPGPAGSKDRMRGVTVGTAVFEWQTLPLTNGPPADSMP